MHVTLFEIVNYVVANVTKSEIFGNEGEDIVGTPIAK